MYGLGVHGWFWLARIWRVSRLKIWSGVFAGEGLVQGSLAGFAAATVLEVGSQGAVKGSGDGLGDGGDHVAESARARGGGGDAVTLLDGGQGGVVDVQFIAAHLAG